ncbi:MAG: CNP1-like family protein [Candidatus Thiosymbion ectosymbiont of Robbea hypermnestra]|nr:CNP1-like family protein [Candidatus Thiosymbion ectosymbiont of Robbea hypermnestra]
MRFFVPAWFLLLVCGGASAAEWDRTLIDEPRPATAESFEDTGGGWKEGVTHLPPWPRNGDLIEFGVDDPAPQFRYYIDGRHISVGSDGVVRYTLIQKSPHGARNVSFEGLRCTPSGAFKTYAYGNQGHFEKTEGDWISLQGRHRDKLRRDLHGYILCRPRAFGPRSKRDMLHTLRTRVPKGASAGFLAD